MTDDDTAHKEPQKATRMLPKDDNFEIKPLKLHRGGALNVVHGLYRKNLTKDEHDLAVSLANDWMERYGLDHGVDLVLAMDAAAAFVKAHRKAPGVQKDEDQQYFQATQARLFREAIESLGINRKNRKGDADGGALAAALAAMMKTRGPSPIEMVKGPDGVHRPAEGEDAA